MGTRFEEAYAHHLAGRLGDAADGYWALIDARDEPPGTRLLLATIARACGYEDLAGALEAAEDGNALGAEGHMRLARVLCNAEEHGRAAWHLDAARGLGEDGPDLHCILGRVHASRGNDAWAEEAYRAALARDPGNLMALVNLGGLIKGQGRVDEARALFDTAVAAHPGDPQARYSRAVTALLQGDLATGWDDYRARWLLAGCVNLPANLPGPAWDGTVTPGKSLMLHAEQGLGDTLMFARFAPWLAARGMRVTLEVHPPLVPVLSTLDSVTVIPRGTTVMPHDGHAALMDVPYLLGVNDQEAIPAAVPYISAELERVVAWRDRLPAGLTIGLCWQGDPESPLDAGRSVPLVDWLPLLTLPGITFVSLQKQHGLEQLADLPENVCLESFGAEMDTDGAFLDTAAIMMSLDLVVTSDTSVAHLAGALGRPCWVALRRVPTWHWGVSGLAMPWYPSMHLFRQDMPGDWRGPVWSIVDALTKALAAP